MTATDIEPAPDDDWDPLKAEYDDLREQELERNQRHYAVRKRRQLAQQADQVDDDDGH